MTGLTLKVKVQYISFAANVTITYNRLHHINTEQANADQPQFSTASGAVQV
jgi:hypothetical protein